MNRPLIYCHICGDEEGPWSVEYWNEKKIFTMMCEKCSKKQKKGAKKNGKA